MYKRLIPVPYSSICCTYHQLKYSSPNLSKKNQEPTFQKMEGKRGQVNGPKAEKDKTERATGLCRRTREEIEKSGIKLTALRFQTWGRHQNRRLPFGSAWSERTSSNPLNYWPHHDHALNLFPMVHSLLQRVYITYENRRWGQESG